MIIGIIVGFDVGFVGHIVPSALSAGIRYVASLSLTNLDLASHDAPEYPNAKDAHRALSTVIGCLATLAAPKLCLGTLSDLVNSSAAISLMPQNGGVTRRASSTKIRHLAMSMSEGVDSSSAIHMRSQNTNVTHLAVLTTIHYLVIL